jgi:hypothetical protein
MKVAARSVPAAAIAKVLIIAYPFSLEVSSLLLLGDTKRYHGFVLSISAMFEPGFGSAGGVAVRIRC